MSLFSFFWSVSVGPHLPSILHHFIFLTGTFELNCFTLACSYLPDKKKKNISQKPVVVAEVLRKHRQGCDEKFPFSWLSPQEITGDLRTVLPSRQK